MKIDLESVRAVFRDVLNGRLTREAADRWAYSLIQQSESGSLIFEPATDRDRIWSGVMYLYGIDSMGEPGQYLHADRDIQVALEKKLGFD